LDGFSNSERCAAVTFEFFSSLLRNRKVALQRKLLADDCVKLIDNISEIFSEQHAEMGEARDRDDEEFFSNPNSSSRKAVAKLMSRIIAKYTRECHGKVVMLTSDAQKIIWLDDVLLWRMNRISPHTDLTDIISFLADVRSRLLYEPLPSLTTQKFIEIENEARELSIIQRSNEP